MKYLVKIFVITFILFSITPVKAEQKILFIDLKKVLNESKPGKKAQDYLQNTFKDNAEKFKKIEQDLKKDEAELIGKKKIISKEEYKKMSEELRNKVLKYQKERRETLDKITRQRASARGQLIEAMKPILDNYMEENNVSIILNKKDVLRAHKDYNITDIIIERLNKKLPSLDLK